MSRAGEALRRARAASKAMRESKNEGEFRIGWASFLSEFQTTYNMMFAVVDDKEGKEVHWRERLKTDRENDQVLLWLTAARHVDSHKAAFEIQHIRPTTEIFIGLIPEDSINPQDVRKIFSSILPGGIVPNSLPLWIKGSTKMVDPPEYHFGKSLKHEPNCKQLWDVTDLALNYLEGMIVEAQKYFTVTERYTLYT